MTLARRDAAEIAELEAWLAVRPGPGEYRALPYRIEALGANGLSHRNDAGAIGIR